jgi:hypothetical protein
VSLCENFYQGAFVATGGFSIFMKSLKAAFLFHWNLLFLGAAAAVGIISGWIDIIFPLAGAAEILYLAVLASNTRFQNVVEGRALQDQASPEPGQSDSKNAAQIIQELSLEDRRQFEKLQGLCQELRQISEGIKGNADMEPAGINNIQLDNMNRLLWIYLNLLYSKSCLENFFRAANEKEIKAGLSSVQNRLNALGPEEQAEDEKQAKTRRSLLDTLQTLDARLKNFQNAKENYDFLQLELERLYSKIAGIVEMGINRQDSEMISSEIDVVASSVMQTEKTMQELQSITGFNFSDDKPPALLKSRKRVDLSVK